MSSPRALLRTFLVERFSIGGALRRFVEDHFEKWSTEINWDDAVVIQAEGFVGIAAERGFVDQLWAPLLQERSAFAGEIQRIRDAWATVAAGSVFPAAPQAIANASSLIDRDRVVEIYRATRTAKLDDIRPALFAGLPDELLTPPAVRRADAQLLIDLHRLNRALGDPPPLLLWIENARLLLEGEPVAETLGKFTRDFETTPAPASTAAEVAETKVTSELEAIVLAHARPAIPVRNGTYAAPDGFWKGLAKRRAFVEAAIAATGRIECPGYDPNMPWAGTGVVVGDDLIVVAGFMVDIFAKNEKKEQSTKLFFDPWRDDNTTTPPRPALEIGECVFSHEYWNLAFFRVSGLSAAGVKPLVVAAKPPAPTEKIVRVTFVGHDTRVDAALQTQVFGGRLDGSKWVLPGMVTAVPPKKRGQPVGRSVQKDLLAYDSTTLGGTGGPVVSLESGQLLGYGLMRLYLIGNWAVPMWEVIRDRRVRELGVAVPPKAPRKAPAPALLE